MFNEKYKEKYRIPSARAMWHDYGGGAYFITVCTRNRECFFGEITHEHLETRCRDAACHVSTRNNEPTMQLTPIGQFLTEKIRDAACHCSYVSIPLFVVMPNHWHAIVFVEGDKIPYHRRDVACRVSTTTNGITDATCRVSTVENETKNKQMQYISNQQGWLSVAIGGIKSAVTKYANENNINFTWQTRFHDHIIRNQNEMNKIAHYIENNPATWDNDCFNKPYP